MITLKAILPNKVTKDILAQLSERLDDIADNIVKELDAMEGIKDWKRAPEFTYEPVTEGSAVGYEFYVDTEIFNYVDKGTRPHEIRPVNASVLAFEAGEKESKQVFTSGKGVVTIDNNTVFTTIVHHPGTEPRNYVQQAAEDIQKKLDNEWAPDLFKEIADILNDGG